MGHCYIANHAVETASEAADGIYIITVMVTDPSGEESESTDTKVVVITATDVDEVPSVKAADGTTVPDTAHMVSENGNLLDEDDLNNPNYDSFMYLAVATDDDDTVSLLLNGDDAAAFKLVDRDGVTGAATVHGLTFKEVPNYEKPTDANKDNAYKVKVVARDDAGHRSETSVTVVVTNVNEDREGNAVVDTACGWDPVDGHRHRS